jgi:hypothetical protein
MISMGAISRRARYDSAMSVDEIKRSLVSLSGEQQREITAFLFHLRHASDSKYQAVVAERLSDRDSASWLTPEEFERRLDQQ